MSELNRLQKLLALIDTLHQSPPKSIKTLISILDTSERSTYRYLALIRDAGFVLKKTPHNTYFIPNDKKLALPSFTDKERHVLNRALQIIKDKEDPDVIEAIQFKIELNEQLTPYKDKVLSIRQTKNLNNIEKAIQNQKQIVLIKYHSLNSESITDRLVEPIHLCPNKERLIALEVSSKTIKTFVLKRITEVEYTANGFQHEKLHDKVEFDPFGFAFRPNKTPYYIELEANLKAKTLMVEEYPLTKPCFTVIPKSKNFIFQCHVNDLRPVFRFIKGLNEDIKIISLPEPLQEIVEMEEIEK